MSPFVVDCSVTMAWCFEDEVSAFTDRVLESLRESEAFVPQVWSLEITNVLAVAERRKRITAAASTRFLELLAELPIRTDSGADPRRLLAVARQTGLSAYDASYLELAMREGFPLATNDRTLSAAARKSGVRLLG